MRFAFVIRLGKDTRPAEGSFEGCIEEVDSGIELRFHSTEQLLRFLGQRFENAVDSGGKIRISDAPQGQPERNEAGRKEKEP